jgi:hypothetical protein
MPITERVIETDKTHQRVEAEKGARGIELCLDRAVGDVSPAFEREVALEIMGQLRDRFPGLRPFMAAAERVGGAEAKRRVAEAAGAPAALQAALESELAAAWAAWNGLPEATDDDASTVLEAYARLLTIVARDPRG